MGREGETGGWNYDPPKTTEILEAYTMQSAGRTALNLKPLFSTVRCESNRLLPPSRASPRPYAGGLGGDDDVGGGLLLTDVNPHRGLAGVDGPHHGGGVGLRWEGVGEGPGREGRTGGLRAAISSTFLAAKPRAVVRSFSIGGRHALGSPLPTHHTYEWGMRADQSVAGTMVMLPAGRLRIALWGSDV